MQSIAALCDTDASGKQQIKSLLFLDRGTSLTFLPPLGGPAKTGWWQKAAPDVNQVQNSI